MLIQISENSAAVTPYGSLARVYQDTGVEQADTIQAFSIKLVWRSICEFTSKVAQKTTKRTSWRCYGAAQCRRLLAKLGTHGLLGHIPLRNQAHSSAMSAERQAGYQQLRQEPAAHSPLRHKVIAMWLMRPPSQRLPRV
jgi:hypothetical protein